MTEEIQPQPAPPPPFAWGFWLLGLLLTLVVGGILNVIAGAMAMSTKQSVLGFLIGVIPGVLAVLLSLINRKSAFAKGVLCAGCVLALIGGICGAGMSNTTFR